MTLAPFTLLVAATVNSLYSRAKNYSPPLDIRTPRYLVPWTLSWIQVWHLFCIGFGGILHDQWHYGHSLCFKFIMVLKLKFGVPFIIHPPVIIANLKRKWQPKVDYLAITFRYKEQEIVQMHWNHHTRVKVASRSLDWPISMVIMHIATMWNFQ